MARLPTLALMLTLAGSAFATAQVAKAAGCAQFREAMVRGAGEIRPEFVRPLVVSRGTAAGLDQFDLVSQARIDGTLRCRGEIFVSFEAKISLPADTTLLARFEKAQEASLVASLGWNQGRALNKVRAMAAEAAEFMRASAERGDVYVAGKVEEHEPGSVDLGLIWTNADRTFIVLVGD